MRLSRVTPRNLRRRRVLPSKRKLRPGRGTWVRRRPRPFRRDPATPRPRMQVTIYPQISGRSRPPETDPRICGENSANRLRSYASSPKLARSISRMRSISGGESADGNMRLAFCYPLFWTISEARKPLGAKKRKKHGPGLLTRISDSAY